MYRPCQDQSGACAEACLFRHRGPAGFHPRRVAGMGAPPSAAAASTPITLDHAPPAWLFKPGYPSPYSDFRVLFASEKLVILRKDFESRSQRLVRREYSLRQITEQTGQSFDDWRLLNYRVSLDTNWRWRHHHHHRRQQLFSCCLSSLLSLPLTRVSIRDFSAREE